MKCERVAQRGAVLRHLWSRSCHPSSARGRRGRVRLQALLRRVRAWLRGARGWRERGIALSRRACARGDILVCVCFADRVLGTAECVSLCKRAPRALCVVCRRNMRDVCDVRAQHGVWVARLTGACLTSTVRRAATIHKIWARSSVHLRRGCAAAALGGGRRVSAPSLRVGRELAARGDAQKDIQASGGASARHDASRPLCDRSAAGG